MANLIIGKSANVRDPAVKGTNTSTPAANVNPVLANVSTGIWSFIKTGVGIFGTCNSGIGVLGVSKSKKIADGKVGGVVGIHLSNGTGVLGVCSGSSGAGVTGECEDGDGVFGKGKRGVVGESDTFQGVSGHSVLNVGVFGESQKFDGVMGISHNQNAAGISGHNPGGLAGYFNGNLLVTGDIVMTNAADFAEDFKIGATIAVEPGTVMVLGKDGALFPSQHCYDKRVVGVVSGAGNYKPGIILDKQPSETNRQSIALLGKVYCKVDAKYGSIEIGDLLTTSETFGYAMKAADQTKSFGSVIGKALHPLTEGIGLIPILIALQ